MKPVQDPELVRRWVSEAEAEVARLNDEAERVGRQLANARRRMTLLHEMLAAVSADPTVINTAMEPLSVRDRVLRDARSILAEAGRPMPVGAIHAEFIRRGFALPGRGSPTNLVAHFGATEQISRLRRGVYALPEWGDDGPAQEGPEST